MVTKEAILANIQAILDNQKRVLEDLQGMEDAIRGMALSKADRREIDSMCVDLRMQFMKLNGEFVRLHALYKGKK